MHEPLSTLLFKYRSMKGISQIDFADMLGVNQSVVSNYENGKRKPSRARLRKIAEILEIDLCELNEHENELISEILANAESMTDYELKQLNQFSNFLLWKREN